MYYEIKVSPSQIESIFLKFCIKIKARIKARQIMYADCEMGIGRGGFFLKYKREDSVNYNLKVSTQACGVMNSYLIVLAPFMDCSLAGSFPIS